MSLSGLVSFFFTPDSPGKIDSITVDAIVTETPKYRALVTDNPVEDGTDISDNVVIKPYMLSISGVITDTPYSEPLNTLLDRDDYSRSKDSYEQLLALFNAKQTFSVVSGLDIYTDVVFTEFQINRDANSGRAIDFNADFKHIVKVSPQTVKIPADTTRDTPPGNSDVTQSGVNKGTQQAQDASHLQQRSLAAALVDSFRGSLDPADISKVVV